MIQDFQVRNFYSIRERQTLSFVPTNDTEMCEQYVHQVADGVGLLKLGIVYGSNASGKTTILNALSYFRSIMLNKPESKSEGMGYQPFLLDNHSRAEHSEMQMTFWINGERYVMSIEFDSNRIYNEQLQVFASVRPTTLYKRQYQPLTDHTIVTFSPKVGIYKPSQQAIIGNTTNNCTVMAALGQSNATSSKLNDIYAFFLSGMQSIFSPRGTMSYDVKAELRNDQGGKKKQFLLQLLKASDFNIVDMTLEQLKQGAVPKNDLVFSHHGEDGNYDLNEVNESAGTHRFLNMAIMLYYVLKENNFVPVDEVETSIHYELLSYFIKLFLANSEGTSQLLMTTHDINLLNEDFIRRDVIWFTDKGEVGATQLKRLSALGLQKVTSPYNAYKQGKLVNLPFMGSIYLDSEM